PEKVAQAIVRALHREPRSAYATLFDRCFVLGSLLVPGVVDRLLARFLLPPSQT
ncbi:MAG: short-chain dehydrogenase, partial [Caldilineae bacterium]